jgi:hypothetical protein
MKARFFDKPDEDVFIDTTCYLDNEFLDDADIREFEKLKGNSPRRYRVEGLGEWGISEGIIFLDYAENPIIHNSADISNERAMLVTAGLDYGSGAGDAPIGESKLGKTVLVGTVITDNFEKVYAVRETYFNDYYRADRIVEWAIDFLVDLRNKYQKAVILYAEWAGSGALNNTLRYEIGRRNIGGIDIRNCYKGTILERIDLHQILLSERRLKFTDAVPRLREAFQTQLWDIEKQRSKGKPVLLDNGATDVDAWDAFGYAINSFASYLLAASKSKTGK